MPPRAEPATQAYTKLSWFATDWSNPGCCPLCIHLPGQDLDPDILGDYERLVSIGWKRFDAASDDTELESADGFVRCWFHEKRLHHVEVNVVALRGRVAPPLSITIFGKTGPLPASEATIVEILGPPSGKKAAAKGTLGSWVGRWDVAYCQLLIRRR